MSDIFEDALIEAYATAKTTVAIIDTVQISHPVIAGSLYLVQALKDLNLTLEDDTQQVFRACGFRLTRPSTGENGRQEMGITLDNTNREAQTFMNLAKTMPYPVELAFRQYLADDLTKPATKQPLTLYMTNVTVTLMQISGRASFTDIINRPFPARGEVYSQERFPTL